MTVARRELMVAAGLLVVALSTPVMADSDDDGWWSRWGIGRGMMDGWGSGGPMMGYGPDALMAALLS